MLSRKVNKRGKDTDEMIKTIDIISLTSNNLIFKKITCVSICQVCVFVFYELKCPEIY